MITSCRNIGFPRPQACSGFPTTPYAVGSTRAGCGRARAAGWPPSTGPSWPRWAQEIARAPELGAPTRESARNRFTGLVTRVVKDTVMAQVDLQCGPFRVVSLMSAEAAEDLQLEPGVLAVASVKSTHVVVEIPETP